LLFRGVHGEIGTVEQDVPGDRPAVGFDDRQPGADADGGRRIGDRAGPADRLDDASADGFGVVHPPAGVGSDFQDDRELVAADAGDGVRGAHAAGQPPGGGAQQFVPGGVPESVVDVLEVVEVAEQQGDRLAVAGVPRHRLVESVGEQCPVGEPGQRIVECLEPDPGQQTGILHHHDRMPRQRHHQQQRQHDAGGRLRRQPAGEDAERDTGQEGVRPEPARARQLPGPVP
jgi:hypothetical protein